MTSDEAEQIAKVDKITDDLDKIIDRLFASVAELKVILRQAAADAASRKEAGQ